jgi:hypothetical protein
LGDVHHRCDHLACALPGLRRTPGGIASRGGARERPLVDPGMCIVYVVGIAHP